MLHSKAGLDSYTSTSSSGARTGGRRRMMALTSVKIAVLAPMPIASDSTALTVNPGFWRSRRTA